jgi:hypothetical protein
MRKPGLKSLLVGFGASQLVFPLLAAALVGRPKFLPRVLNSHRPVSVKMRKIPTRTHIVWIFGEK